MNRWRVRLAELQSDAFAPPARVQNVQIVQKLPSVTPSEHFEQIEQQPVLAPQDDTWPDAEEERAAIAECDSGAPRAWAEALARTRSGAPGGRRVSETLAALH